MPHARAVCRVSTKPKVPRAPAPLPLDCASPVFLAPSYSISPGNEPRYTCLIPLLISCPALPFSGLTFNVGALMSLPCKNSCTIEGSSVPHSELV